MNKREEVASLVFLRNQGWKLYLPEADMIIALESIVVLELSLVLRAPSPTRLMKNNNDLGTYPTPYTAWGGTPLDTPGSTQKT